MLNFPIYWKKLTKEGHDDSSLAHGDCLSLLGLPKRNLGRNAYHRVFQKKALLGSGCIIDFILLKPHNHTVTSVFQGAGRGGGTYGSRKGKQLLELLRVEKIETWVIPTPKFYWSPFGPIRAGIAPLLQDTELRTKNNSRSMSNVSMK